MLYFFLILESKLSNITKQTIRYENNGELYYLSLEKYKHYWNITEPIDIYDQNDLCLCCQEISWMDETR